MGSWIWVGGAAGPISMRCTMFPRERPLLFQRNPSLCIDQRPLLVQRDTQCQCRKWPDLYQWGAQFFHESGRTYLKTVFDLVKGGGRFYLEGILVFTHWSGRSYPNDVLNVGWKGGRTYSHGMHNVSEWAAAPIPKKSCICIYKRPLLVQRGTVCRCRKRPDLYQRCAQIFHESGRTYLKAIYHLFTRAAALKAKESL